PAAKVEGPMRVELLGLIDQRVFFVEPVPERAPKTALRIILKLTGEKLGELYRAGRAVIEDVVDDTGAKLLDGSAMSDKDKAATAPINVNGIVQQGYQMLDVLPPTPPNRLAKKIPSLKGYVNIVFGGPTEEVTIENPLQYMGKPIDNPKLKA